MAVLRSRLLEMEQRKAHEAEAAVRRSMVGSGERAEKIRTYNFPQDRITDHRIGLDVHDLPGFLDGDLDRLIDVLVTDGPGRATGGLRRCRRRAGARARADGRGLTSSADVDPAAVPRHARVGGSGDRRATRATAGAAGSESARLDAEVLLGHVLGVDRGAACPPIPRPPSGDGQQASYEALVERRATRASPWPTSAASRSSTALALLVDRRVLIPRPETETLVELALERITRVLTSGAARRPAEPVPRLGRGHRHRRGRGRPRVRAAPSAVRRRGALPPDGRLCRCLAVAVENAVSHGVADLWTSRSGDLVRRPKPSPGEPVGPARGQPAVHPRRDLPDLPVAASFEPVRRARRRRRRAGAPPAPAAGAAGGPRPRGSRAARDRLRPG